MKGSARDPYAGSEAELRERLRALTEEVARNELLLRKTQAREVELLRAHSLGELFDRIVTGLRDAYALDFVTLSLFDPQHELRHLSGNENLSSTVHRRSAIHRCGVAARAATRAIRSAVARTLQPG